MTVLNELDVLVDWKNGLVAPAIHVDEEVYRTEAARVFGRSWLLVGHEQMVPTPGTYITNYMGEVPVIVSRDRRGEIHVLVNKCSHRGNQVCLFDRGKARGFACSYHGWSYGLDGTLNGIPVEDFAYREGVDKSQLGLEKVAKVANYGGLLFATFDAGAPELESWLGEDGRWWLDNLVLSQDLGGLELLPGFHRYHSPGNWKLAAENFFGDTYHVYTATHVAWIGVCVDYMKQGNLAPMIDYPSGTNSTHLNAATGVEPGRTPFGMGMLVMDQEVYKRDYAEAQRLGPEAVEWVEHRFHVRQKAFEGRADWPYGFMHAGMFPNAGLMGFISPLVGRHFLQFHPRGAQAHETWQWTMVEREAPQVVKEVAAQRVFQGQHPAGLIAPDDVENFERILEATVPDRNRTRPFHYGQQLGHETEGPAGYPGQVGPSPSEANQRAFYRHWLELMDRG
ncbi:biphenyl 2,3-dioxygenase alpha subunit/dibenzofuran dioxygenase alpha subunit [Pseudonocardia ammonioxydans]|uniref:Biphenyl 2,3-dioxygenase alpha subunit/dibenzofuran dioxygenase alpha subunit n=1 Tax=Pseudonocardia ammonioxydans TaxID=260086 RepID=A0A1I5FXG3_PSUAM|nr:Rieske 2Fe-2S domain-containing protein [Pseudonocardia ammonioxydans]SFO28518.1 biphenyl 2,3-dioxygenase alpha subunit/dibenzofuran dioxygenase alpha subunit [Pseudonocardia ammonioxydans]